MNRIATLPGSGAGVVSAPQLEALPEPADAAQTRAQREVEATQRRFKKIVQSAANRALDHAETALLPDVHGKTLP